MSGINSFNLLGIDVSQPVLEQDSSSSATTPKEQRLPSPLSSRQTVTSSSSSSEKRSLKGLISKASFKPKWFSKFQSVQKTTPETCKLPDSTESSPLGEQRLPSSTPSSPSGGKRPLVRSSSSYFLSNLKDISLSHTSEEQRLLNPALSSSKEEERRFTSPMTSYSPSTSSSSSSSHLSPSPILLADSTSTPLQKEPVDLPSRNFSSIIEMNNTSSLNPHSPHIEKCSYAKKPSSRSPSPRYNGLSPTLSPIRALGLPKKSVNIASPISNPIVRNIKSQNPTSTKSAPSSTQSQNHYTTALLLNDLYDIIQKQSKQLKIAKSTIQNINQNYQRYSIEQNKALHLNIISACEEIIFPLYAIFKSKINTPGLQITASDAFFIRQYKKSEGALFREAFFTITNVQRTILQNTLTYEQNLNSYFSNLTHMTSNILFAYNSRCLDENDKSVAIGILFDNIDYFLQFIGTYPEENHFQLKSSLYKTLSPFFEGRDAILGKLKEKIYLNEQKNFLSAFKTSPTFKKEPEA